MQRQDDDDEFFHVTCHITGNLRSKIAKGEYVDLEQLLPKSKGAGGYVLVGEHTEESRVELVTRDGHTYFKPVKETQITGLRKWEQAFRVYAAIYTEHNPERSGEIWQYIHNINIAASSFHWNNVANYDVTFRHLMSARPHRSWAKLYNQGWNLAMRDPIGKTGVTQSFNQQRDNNDIVRNQGGFKKNKTCRDYCCWKYNKNKCSDTKCEFDHRCTYCGGWNHSFYNCRKRLGKRKSHDGNSNGAGRSGAGKN